MFEPEGRVTQPPGVAEHWRAAPQGGAANIEARAGVASAGALRCHSKAPNLAAQRKAPANASYAST
jgi:hypothetical protein